MEFPNEVWTNIYQYCDLSSLLCLMQTCKRLYSICNTGLVWSCQWKKLLAKHHQQPSEYNERRFTVDCNYDPNSEVQNSFIERNEKDDFIYKDDSSVHKAMCFRFTKIFGSDPAVDFVCCKCSGVLCNTNCMENSDELIIFDFGSKTTWFKYESENTGQLSMHPTVAPINGISSTDYVASNDDPMLTDACPVCTKIIKKRQSGLLVANTVLPKDKKKFTSAFTKLSLKGLHCFESSQLDTDETEYSAGLSNEDVNFAVLGTPHRNEGTSDSEINSTDYIFHVEPLLFLMTHMLKRSAFLPGKNIPFVICEPLHMDKSMKYELVKYVFEELKVPGVCFLSKPIAISLYIGLDTCLVVDSGANNTTVTPVVNQNPMADQWKPVGGRNISTHLKQCIRMKYTDLDIDDGSLDSSQVKRECWVAYNPEMESKRNIPSKNITVKAHRSSEGDHRIDETDHCQITLSHELYLAVENMYANLQLASLIKESIAEFESHTQIKLLSNIVLSGGNCRLQGLANRLTRDLQEVLPQYSHNIRVCDPRLLTRTDVVVGASYIKRLDSVNWITREDYVCYGQDIMNEST